VPSITNFGTHLNSKNLLKRICASYPRELCEISKILSANGLDCRRRSLNFPTGSCQNTSARLPHCLQSILKSPVPGFSSRALTAACAYIQLPPYPSFHSAGVCPLYRATLRPASQPASCIHQNSISAGKSKINSRDACCDRSPSPGGVVPLLEICFGFSPTPPGRYLGL
jgi:hypothetical protein